jgi:molybdenum cofactor synthesis domain-containing protein
VRVELVAVGTELLLGDIVNGNAAWLGQRLAEAGLDVAHSTVVGDNIDRIADVLRLALSRADAVLVTGGIGPTQDDLTREALAAVAGVALVRDPVLESALRERFTALRRDVPEMNYRQADVPEGGVPLPNAKGTAPGMRLVVGAGVVYLMPGVPHEMEAMFAESVLPDLLHPRGRAGGHRQPRPAHRGACGSRPSPRRSARWWSGSPSRATRRSPSSPAPARRACGSPPRQRRTTTRWRWSHRSSRRRGQRSAAAYTAPTTTRWTPW